MRPTKPHAPLTREGGADAAHQTPGAAHGRDARSPSAPRHRPSPSATAAAATVAAHASSPATSAGDGALSDLEDSEALSEVDGGRGSPLPSSPCLPSPTAASPAAAGGSASANPRIRCNLPGCNTRCGATKRGFAGLGGFKAHLRTVHADKHAEYAQAGPLGQQLLTSWCTATSGRLPDPTDGSQPTPREAPPYPTRDGADTCWPPPARDPANTGPELSDYEGVTVIDLKPFMYAGRNVRLAHTFPAGLWRLWHDCLRLTFKLAMDADFTKEQAGWTLLLILPSLLLWCPSGTCVLPSNDAKSRMRAYKQGKFRELAAEFWLANNAAAPPPRNRNTSLRNNDLSRKTRRCQTLHGANEIGRAASALLSDLAQAPADRTTAERLAKKFPAAPLPVMPDEQALPPAVAVSKLALLAAVRRMPRKSAGGLSGVNTELLASALLDDDALAELALPVVQRIVDGRIPVPVKRFLLAAKLIGLTKPDAAAAVAAARTPAEIAAAIDSATRPIGMGEWLTRLATAIAVNADKAALIEHLAPGGQLGVGLPAGCEAASRGLQLCKELYPDQPVARVDLREAFQNFTRQDLLNALHSNDRLARLLHIASLLYANERDAVFHLADGTPCVAPCLKGAMQGCPSGSPFFCVAIADTLKWLRGRATFVVAIADDITFSAPVDDMGDIFRDLFQRLIALGLTVNRAKCFLLHLGGELPGDLRALFQAPAVPYDGNGPAPRSVQRWADASTASANPAAAGFVVVGVPFGTPEYVEAQLDIALAAATKDLTRIATALTVNRKAGLSLIRNCVHPRFGYLLRCISGDAAAAAADKFDAQLVAAVGQLHGTAVDSVEALGTLSLRTSDGGYGVSKQSKLAPVAFLAGYIDTRATLAVTHPELMAAMPPLNALPAAPAAGSVVALAHNALEQLRLISPEARAKALELSTPPQPPPAAVGAAPVAPTLLAKLQLRHRHVQTLIAEPVHKALLAAHRAAIAGDQRALAQHNSQSGELGCAWLDAPSTGLTAVDTELARIAFLDAHALPLPEAAGMRCPSCHAKLDPATAIRHLSLCDKDTTARHRTIGTALIAIASACPGVEDVIAEPRGILANPKVPDGRPDLVFGPITGAPAPYDSKQCVMDHTITNSLSATRIAAAAKKPGTAAVAAHKKKMHDSAPHLDKRLYAFVPFAIEAHGRLHPEALAFLNMLATTTARHRLSSTVTPVDAATAARTVAAMASQLLTSWLRLISTALISARAKRVRVMLAKARASAAGNRPVLKGRGGYVYKHISRSSVRRLLLDASTGSRRPNWLS